MKTSNGVIHNLSLVEKTRDVIFYTYTHTYIYFIMII